MSESQGPRRGDLQAGSEKTSGHATTTGQDFEVALCCLVFLRALRLASDFFLLSNYAPAGNLDDVVLFYKLPGDLKYRAILLQAKYRENPQEKKLTKSNPFKLGKYVDSFTEIRDSWAEATEVDGQRIEVGEVSVALYSSDSCDFAGVASDVTARSEVQVLREFLDTEGRLLRFVDPQWEGLSEDFIGHLTLCTEQMSLDETDEYLERELVAVLGLTSSADAGDLRTLLWGGVKCWWASRGTCRRLTAQSPEWTHVLETQVARLNALVPQLDLRFSPEALAAVRSALDRHELTWITVADERQARATRGRLLQALGGSCLVLDAAADGQVSKLWGTAVCPTLVLDLSTGSPPDWSRLLGDVRGDRRLAVVALHGTPPPEVLWFPLQAEATWSVLDQATRDGLLAIKVNLEGHVVALRDVVGGDVSDITSDELISALCDPAAGVLQLGVAPESSALKIYVPRCLQRTYSEEINSDALQDAKSLIFTNNSFSSMIKNDHTFQVLSLSELERARHIPRTTVVEGALVDSEIRKVCCRLGVRGFSEDVGLERRVTEFAPSTWLCKDKVVVVEGVAGVGKSTFVTAMSLRVKERFPACWVLSFDLAKHTAFIKERDFSDAGDITEFLLRVLPEEQQSLPRDLLGHSLYVAGNVFLFLDAFDEMGPKYTSQCCRLLKGIASTVKFRQMIVATRPVNTVQVEEALGAKAFNLPFFGQDQQKLFLEKFCMSNDMIFDNRKIWSLREAAGSLLEVPLLCRMDAEVLLYSENQNLLRFKNPWRKVLLYKRVVEQAIVNRLSEKLDIPKSVLGETVLESQSKEHLRNLQAMAVRKLIPEDQLPNVELSSELPDEKLGLVVGDGASVDFEHRTFAEFFLGRWLAQHWEQCPPELLRELLAREDYEFVAATLSWSLFEDFPEHLAVARGEKVRSETTDRGGRSTLHVAAMTRGGQLPEFAGEDLLRRDKVLGATAASCAEMVENWGFLEALVGKGKTQESLKFLTDQDAAKKVLVGVLELDLIGLLHVIFHLHPGIFNLRFTDNGDTLLHKAAANNSTQVLKCLINQSHEVNVVNCDGVTPLHKSAVFGHVEAMALLLDSGADPNSTVKYGVTPLLMAACQGHLAAVRLLLGKGVDPNGQKEIGNTALIVAAGQGQVEVVKALLEGKADPHLKNENGYTALITASQQGQLEVVRLLLQNETDPNVQNEEGCTALTLAAGRGHPEVVQLLLEAEADPNVRNKYGDTAVMMASHQGQLEVVKVLLEMEANPNMENKLGNTALLMAAARGHYEVAKVLLERRADQNMKNKDGYTVLMVAAHEGYPELVNVLLENGADPNVQNELGWTALTLAVDSGHLDVAKLLLERGADPNLRNTGGHAVLATAVVSGHLELVTLLLEKGADPNVKNKNGVTSLMVAAFQGHLEVVRALLEKAADRNITFGSGYTALMLAADAGHVEVVKVLQEEFRN